MALDPRPLIDALRAIENEPRAIEPILAVLSASTDRVDLDDLAIFLAQADVSDPARNALHLALARWDGATSLGNHWTDNTESKSAERRILIYRLLGLPEKLWPLLDTSFPRAETGAFVIADGPKSWFDASRQQRRPFYWPAYRDYLLSTREWPVDSVDGLDRATTMVLERLSDPAWEKEYQSKGLVVGYVQSGKTANFTGVMAKAVDAGYRLIIVLTGTIDLLRQQTQRRIDMELVGQENILRGVDVSDAESVASLDYQQDPDWPNGFISHGVLPSTVGYPDIIRLTGYEQDYKSLSNGITTLELEKRDRSQPLYTPENLDFCAARVAIVKKNSRVLERLVDDLKRVKSYLADVPVLIIDDESDQASIDTTNPDRRAAEERTAINSHIRTLLHLMRRSQYVGYTATPFANVFVSPDDALDIFPKDFIIGLDRPLGYMGASDFHDLDRTFDDGDPRTWANSKQKRFVRDLRMRTVYGKRRELLGAMDAFVLSGAIKLYRERQAGTRRFRHHTMLVHESASQQEHLELAKVVDSVWRSAGYRSVTGNERLRRLFEEDFVHVTAAHDVTAAMPSNFDELRPFVQQCVTNVTRGRRPVLIVNGDNDLEQDELNFVENDVWRIIVGGTKLSRGFTVEGLTISYYRRRAGAADTLMQMGRWFGFRDGYEDLVRLYVGRDEPIRRDGTGSYDIYRAFEDVVRDEEHFRLQLRAFAARPASEGGITPLEVQPHVARSGGPRPTSRNKMFNTRLVMRRSPGEPFEPVVYPTKTSDLCHDYDVMRPVAEVATIPLRLRNPHEGSGSARFNALVGVADHLEVLRAIEAMRWMYPEDVAPDLAYLREISGALVDDWFVILPQTAMRPPRNLPDLGDRSVFKRERREGRGGRMGFVSESKHRPAARKVAGAEDYADADLEAYVQDRRGAMIIYPVVTSSDLLTDAGPPLTKSDVILAMVLVAPGKALRTGLRLVEYTALSTRRASDPIIDVQDASA